MVNIAIAAVLLFTVLPIALFGVVQVFPPLSNSATKTEAVEDAASKRISVAERRARRRDAREAKRALAKTKNTPNEGESPMLYHLRMEERYVNPGLVGYDIERMFPGAMDKFGFGPSSEAPGGFGSGADVGFNPEFDGGFGPGFGPGGDMGRFAPQFDSGFDPGFGGGFGGGFSA